MSFIECILRKKNRITCYMIILVQNILCFLCNIFSVRYKIISIKFAFFVRCRNSICRCLTEVVFTIGKCISQHSVSVCRIIEWIRRCYAAVCPSTFVCDIDRLSRMNESAVLCTAAVEVFSVVFLKSLYCCRF